MRNEVLPLFPESTGLSVAPFRQQLLKWIGNKQRFAHRIASLLPADAATYHEPFLGSGAVLGTLAPAKAFASDALLPLAEIWMKLSSDPEGLKAWYADRRLEVTERNRVESYERIKASYNAAPNGADLLFLCRACYGGVVRFRKRDGHMSTPCGAHNPVSVGSFSARVDEWHRRTRGTAFRHMDFREAFQETTAGDVVYCDPPYSDSQTILYGAQTFSLHDLVEEIATAKARGVRVALSIDGSKKSGIQKVLHEFPEGMFETEVAITVGRSMLRRFQMSGETLENEVVMDRLLLTY